MLNQLSVEDSPPSIRHQNGKRSGKGGAHGGTSLDAASSTYQQYLGMYTIQSLVKPSVNILLSVSLEWVVGYCYCFCF